MSANEERMHVGLYHEPVHTDGRTFDTYGPYARYVLEFARHFDRVTVFAPTTDQPTYFSGVPLDAPNITVAPLPFFLTHAQAYAHAIGIARVFRKHAGNLDVINCRNTAPLAYLLRWLTRKRGVPFIYHFSTDPFEVIGRSERYRGLYRRFARTAYGLEFAIQKRIMRKNHSFTTGRRLCDQLRHITPNVEPLLASSLRDDDYYQREDTCGGEVVRVLYVGRLHPGKGLDHLIAAVKMLRDRGRAVELDLVGEGPLRNELASQVQGTGLGPHVRLHGHAVVGPELNAHYNAADVFAMPSLSETGPMAVLEAMGHSLPVVATDVGSVREMLDEGRRGMIVMPGDSAAIAEAVAHVIDDGDFRRRCIREGFEFAREHGVSAFVAPIVRTARQLVQERRSRRDGP